MEKRAASDGHADARAGLTELAHTLLDTARKMVPLMMMMMSNPSIADKEGQVKRAQWILKSLADYFELEIEAGRVSAIDPRVAARVWLGSIRQLVMFDTLGPPVDGLSNAAFIAGLVEMFCPPLVKPRKK